MTRGAPLLARRGVLGLAAGIGLLRPLRALARAESGGSPNIDVSGNLPALRFTLTRATDAEQVTAADYRGNVVLLYFGYTFCPDVCPLTLTNIDAVLKRTRAAGVGRAGAVRERRSRSGHAPRAA